VAPAITDGRTMVPLRFVSEELGATVDWDGQNNSVLITTVKPDLIYTVKEGDTLWRISQSYGVSVDEISKENPGMNPDKLIIGQRLNLPAGSVGKGSNTSSGVNTSDPSQNTEDSEDQTNLSDQDNPVVSRGGGRTVSLNCTADELVEYAKEYLGVPYAYGGATPDGFDCSGFTQYVTENFGGYLPHSSSEQYHYGISVDKDELQPGDLVFFGTSGNTNQIGHVGIYIGDGKFIHAPQSGGTVEISNMSNVYFDRYYYGAVRMELK
jgi:Cell wall-associated hydrolases (invasion-associated proteins)